LQLGTAGQATFGAQRLQDIGRFGVGHLNEFMNG
jgi:hypothetical protein